MKPGLRLGYKRVSTHVQNLSRQLDGVMLDKEFTDIASGKNRDRPRLDELLAFAREGDTIIVHSMDRLARNLLDLRNIIQDLLKRGVTIEFKTEGLTFTGDDSPMSMFMLSVMGAFSEFERSINLERQKEGIAIAKAAGKFKGKKAYLTPQQAEELRTMNSAGVPKSRIARQFGIARATVYLYLKSE